jgi:ubiquitin carboxyl-terminal hydrolase 4/11
MESESSSSSVKRTGASLETRNTCPGEIPLSSIDDDIDAYMANQGEGDSFDTLSPSISPEQKLLSIDELNKRPMEVNDSWYLVSKQWYKRWRKACTGEVDKEGPVNEQDLGPVDNSPIVDRDGNLVSPVIEGLDVEFVHPEAWRLLVQWYVLSHLWRRSLIN